MEQKLIADLVNCGTNVAGVLAHFIGDYQKYVQAIMDFIEDRSLEEIEVAIELGRWKRAEELLEHFLGRTELLGFIPLYYMAGQLKPSLRFMHYSQAMEKLSQVTKEFYKIQDIMMDYQTAKEYESAKESLENMENRKKNT